MEKTFEQKLDKFNEDALADTCSISNAQERALIRQAEGRATGASGTKMTRQEDADAKASFKRLKLNGGPITVPVKYAFEPFRETYEKLPKVEQAALVCTGGKRWGWAVTTLAMLIEAISHQEDIARGVVTIGITAPSAKAVRIGLATEIKRFTVIGQVLLGPGEDK